MLKQHYYIGKTQAVRSMLKVLRLKYQGKTVKFELCLEFSLHTLAVCLLTAEHSIEILLFFTLPAQLVQVGQEMLLLVEQTLTSHSPLPGRQSIREGTAGE